MKPPGWLFIGINSSVTSMDTDRGYVSIISSKTFASQGLVIILDLAKVPKEDDGTTLWKYATALNAQSM